MSKTDDLRPLSRARASPRAWWVWLLLALLSAIPFWVAFQIRGGLAHDDAFITFTYARNIAEGHGFVYNGGAPRLGTTTPLLTLLLAGLKWLLPGAEIYAIALWAGAVLWAGAGLMAYLVGRRIAGPPAGLALAAMHATMATFPYVLPAEYPLLFLLSLSALYLAIAGRYWAAGIAFGLAFLARGDAAILAGLVGLVLLLRDRRVPWGLGIGFALTLLPWFVYAFILFGNPLPAALAMKRAHRALEIWPHLYVGFWRWLVRSGPWLQVWLAGVALFSVVALVLSIIRHSIWTAVIVLWGLLYAAAYAALDIHFYFWYNTPLLEALALGAGLGLALLLRPDPAQGRSFRVAGGGALRIATVLLAAGVLVLGAFNVRQIALNLSQVRPRQAAYVATGRWLAENIPANSTAGFIEIGLIGYFSHRQIVDLLGLITPGMEPYLLKRDHAGILQAYHPDYYIRNGDYDEWPLNRKVHESAYFKQHYVPVAEIPQAGAKPVVIYRWTGD